MTKANQTSDATAGRGSAPDRPPIGRFLVLFAGLLAVALGLSALSAPTGPADLDPPLQGQSSTQTSAEAAKPHRGP